MDGKNATHTGPAQPQTCTYATLLRREATINEKKQAIIIVAMLCVAALLLGVGGCTYEIDLTGTQATQTTATTARTTTVEPTIAVKIEDITKDHIGKQIELNGEATAFWAGSSEIRITLHDGSEAGIYCYFTDPAELEKAAELNINDNIIIAGTYGDGLRGCSIRLASGSEIEVTPVPPIKDGICELTVEEYLALDVARNHIRGGVLFGDAKAQITGKVTKVGVSEFFLFLKWWTNYYIYIGDKIQFVDCGLSYNDYMTVSKGDIVTIQGVPGIVTNNELRNCKIINIVPAD